MRFEIGLERPGQLFTADPPPPTSPVYSRFTVEPALEVVRRESWRLRRHDPVVIDLALPADEVHPNLADELTGAARRWFAVADDVDTSVGRAETVVGVRTFLPSLALFFALILVSFVVVHFANRFGDSFVRALGQGLTVAAWVILWVPVERVSSDTISRRARRRRAAALATATVEVRVAG